MRFSVVICTYNRANHLKKSLESAVSQNYPKNQFEILIVDNNSPDDTAVVCRSFQEKYDEINIRYFLETQQGISYGRNRGVTEARGEFIAFLDDDETILPDYLNHLHNFFESYPEASLCAGPVVPVCKIPEPEWMSPYISRPITGLYDKGSNIKILKPKDCPGTGHATFRRSLFEKIGGFNTDLGRKGSSLLGAEDKDFFLRLNQQGVSCYYLPSAIIYHHIPASKLTEDFFNKMTRSIGVSEKIRTQTISRTAFYKRLIIGEGIKWCGTLVLSAYYFLQFKFSKGKKLLQFRTNITRGLITSPQRCVSTDTFVGQFAKRPIK